MLDPLAVYMIHDFPPPPGMVIPAPGTKTTGTAPFTSEQPEYFVLHYGHIRHIFPLLPEYTYDIIHLHISVSNYHYLPLIRKKYGNTSTVIIAAYIPHDFKVAENKEVLKELCHSLESADMIFCSQQEIAGMLSQYQYPHLYTFHIRFSSQLFSLYGVFFLRVLIDHFRNPKAALLFTKAEQVKAEKKHSIAKNITLLSGKLPHDSKRPPAEQVAFTKSKECRKQSLQSKRILVDMDRLQRKRLPFDREAHDCTLICLLKNGEPYIRDFMDHYVRLGIKHFIFIDNDSTDNSRELLQGYPGVTLYTTSLSFKDHECDIRREIIDRTCKNRWCLCVDIDEFFDFPYSDRIPLSRFLGYLEEQDYTAVVAHMLDMFGKKSADFTEENKGVQTAYPYYDVSFMDKREYPLLFFECAHNKLPNPYIPFFCGGIRKKHFNTKLPFFLIKHPLMFIDNEIEPFTHPHFCNNARIADITCVLKHYKFTHSFPGMVKQVLQEKNYPFYSMMEYDTYNTYLEENATFDFFSPDAKEYTAAADLIKTGFVMVSDIYMEFIGKLQKND